MPCLISLEGPAVGMARDLPKTHTQPRASPEPGNPPIKENSPSERISLYPYPPNCLQTPHVRRIARALKMVEPRSEEVPASRFLPQTLGLEWAPLGLGGGQLPALPFLLQFPDHPGLTRVQAPRKLSAP